MKAVKCMTKKRMLSTFTLLPIITFLSGCAFIHSEPPVAKKTDIAKLTTITIPNGGVWPSTEWWKQYNNPQLNQLVAQALADSPTLAVVEQRVMLAKAQTETVRAGAGANLNFGADVERQKVSAEGILGPFAVDDPAAGTTGPWYTNGTFGLQGSYEFDIWGKDRDRIEAALGLEQAKQAELAESKLLVSSAVTELYWDMQTVMALQDTLQQMREQEALIVHTDEKLYSEGISSSLDDTVGRVSLAKLDQRIASNQGELHALQATLGAMLGLQHPLPEIKAVPLPDVSQPLPPKLDYQLLARRPDLQAAHWYIQSSLSQTEAARAAFYPTVNLMGFLQYDALHLSDLFRSSAQQAGGILGFTLPIFDSGRLNANLAVVQSDSNLAIASYNKAVVSAVTDVVKDVSAMQTLAEERVQQQQVVDGETHILSLVQRRFNAGLASGNQVSKARIPLLEEQANLLILKNKANNADISLITSLGGGYHQGAAN